ncbi:hypothetical protein DSC45_34715 [Streptomyces sp. YIM 130001]|uniref:hypothetical protein n=1 Tax=Streptomyces sp. YIM 130001 TaxID=2259644 RepID=UPI000E651309|nr:hypothetical protein [Streptomyces sp. YIM 130001]RII06983.1 hypothetical protein DSC45_34715 [Streptomyces sp. YIM 130001]
MLEQVTAALQALAEVPERFGIVVAASAGWLIGGAVLVAVGGTAVWVWWRRRARAALAHRAVVDFIPAGTFDPSAEAIDRQAARIARVPEAAGWLPRRASGVRIRLVCTDSRLAYQLEAPERAAALLRLPSFAEVDIADAGTTGPQRAQRIRFEQVPPLPSADPAVEGDTEELNVVKEAQT